MADRARCAYCGGDFAVTSDGTPWKHSLPGPDQTDCPGSDQPALNPEDLVWHLYAGEKTRIDHTGTEQAFYSHVLVGPVSKDMDVSADQDLPLVKTFDHAPSHSERMAELPEEQRTPDPSA